MGTRGFSSMKFTAQERLSKDDIRLLLNVMHKLNPADLQCTDTRMELLIGKLKRMEKQK